MGLDSQIYIREIEIQQEPAEFQGNSRFIALAVLLSIILATFLGGYCLSLLVSVLIR